MKRPRDLGARPRQSAGPSASAPLLIEHLSEYEGWAVIENGRQVNPFCRTAPALAYYLSREGLTARVANLDVLQSPLRDIAQGKRK